jgi:predicted nucleic acid-binding protein
MLNVFKDDNLNNIQVNSCKDYNIRVYFPQYILNEMIEVLTKFRDELKPDNSSQSVDWFPKV